MKYSFVYLMAFIAFSCSSFAGGNHGKNLSPKDFETKLANKKAQLIDVRTAEEFAVDHLPNAINMDWNSDAFQNEISKLDKTQPVFLYCLSGGRSDEAINFLNSKGYQAYGLEGGILKWKAQGLAVVAGEDGLNVKSGGMSLDEYQKNISTGNLVLVDFYAEWCGPCKLMAPFLKEIENEYAGQLKVIRIDTDKNRDLAIDLGIQALPTLYLYNKKEIVWSQIGYVPKTEIAKQLDAQINP